MIILDTHVWIWWINQDSQLPQKFSTYIQAEQMNGLGVSAISCWEVAKLVELNRLQLHITVDQWLSQAVQHPIQLLPLSLEIAVGSSRLPGTFHRDPSDQIIVATARHYDCPLVTQDRLIRAYPHVKIAP